MKENKNSFSVSRGLSYKLRLAFYLMSVLPLLASIYLASNYILPQTGPRLDVILTIIISCFIATLGLLVIKSVFDRIRSISSEARLIAAGDITRRLDIAHEDEVGDLGNALNLLAQRIRSNMDELKGYSEKTTEINLEIQKRILVLSSLLQISSLISQGAQLEDTLRLSAEKARLIANSEASYLLFREENGNGFYMKAADGINAQYLSKIKIGLKESIFDKLITSNRALVLDNDNLQPENLKAAFCEEFKLKNTLALPILVKGKVIAILGIGNIREPSVFKKDDLDLLDVFAKQVAIAIENDLLMHRIDKLEIKDTLTGLYNEMFIRNRLDEEIKRAIAYQRPCAYILLDVDNFREFNHNFGSLQAEEKLKKIATLIRSAVTEVDRVGRVGDNEFGIILPERNKRHAQTIAEDIRKKIEFSFSEEQDINKRLTISGGVSENPLDGVDAAELINKAGELTSIAKKQGKNRIVVFKEPPICQ